uniref:Uncharacterized protein n=1 Tax=Oryza brachyantha TaxID=4533 RepID=J3N4R6_ORYBR
RRVVGIIRKATIFLNSGKSRNDFDGISSLDFSTCAKQLTLIQSSFTLGWMYIGSVGYPFSFLWCSSCWFVMVQCKLLL